MKADILFSYFPKITFQRYKKLIREAGSLEAAWEGDTNIFLAAGWQPELVDEFFAWKKTVNTKKLDEILRQEHITAIPYGDEHYPTLLQELYDPPLCLFVRGTLPTHTNTTVGVVGTRAYTPYGKQVVDAYIPPLVEAGACIVSGLAIGIDSLAHKKTLDHGGVTLGVLGSGVNKTHVFPKENNRLGEDIIAQGGALISEYPPYTLPTVYSFPKRNRIIAGLSRATLIIEAGEKSGALITAQVALDLHRDVFAVPHNIFSPKGKGNNKLIAQGAHLTESPKDIQEILGLQTSPTYVTNTPIPHATKEEQTILAYLSKEPLHIDALGKLLNIKIAELSGRLTIMEMNALVKHHGGMLYSKQ